MKGNEFKFTIYFYYLALLVVCLSHNLNSKKHRDNMRNIAFLFGSALFITTQVQAELIINGQTVPVITTGQNISDPNSPSPFIFSASKRYKCAFDSVLVISSNVA